MRLVYSPLLAEWCVRNLQKHKSQTDLTLLNKPRISWNHTPPVPLSTMPPVLNTIVSTLLARITPCSPNHGVCFGGQKRPHSLNIHILYIICLFSGDSFWKCFRDTCHVPSHPFRDWEAHIYFLIKSSGKQRFWNPIHVRKQSIFIK